MSTPASTAPTPAPAAAGQATRLPTGGGLLEGPWQQAFWFTVPGPVRSKSNHRRGDRSSTGTSVWRLLESYELTVRSISRQHRPAGWDKGVRDAPVAARPKVVVFCFARSVLDAGNLDKSLHDALQGEVMVTDAQVCWSTGAGIRTTADPGVLVAVARLDATASLADQTAAGCALPAAAMRLLVPADH